MDTKDKEILLAQYHELYRGMLEKDIIALEKLLADSFTLTHMTGYVQAKSEWLDDIESEAMLYYSAQEDDVVVTIKGETALVDSKNRVNARIWGAGPNTWNLRLVSYFEKQNNEWVLTKTVASTYIR